VLLWFGPELRFEPEPSWTGHRFRVQVLLVSRTEPNFGSERPFQAEPLPYIVSIKVQTMFQNQTWVQGLKFQLNWTCPVQGRTFGKWKNWC